MAAARTAAEIKSRFETEQDYIQRYVDFLRGRSTITDRQITDLVRLLKLYKLPLLHRRKNMPLGRREFTPQHIADLLASVEQISPVVEEALTKQALVVEQFVNPPEPGPGVNVPHEAGEWVTFMLEHLYDEPTPNNIANLRLYVKGRLEHETGRDFTDTMNEAGLDYIITITVLEYGRRKLDHLRHLAVRLSELQLLGRVLSPETEINVLRQGFILLMTAFDAAIFDLVRVALRRKFFTLISAFGKQDKFSLQEIAQMGSFDALQEEIIEEQLKKRYVKDLLHLLGNEWKAECVDKAAGDKFERLIEFVLRRNVHVHNRGIVDERYLDEDKNLDRLKLGDVAVIDEPYWEMANRLCGECVKRVTDWAST
jgi:hypothetical protein